MSLKLSMLKSLFFCDENDALMNCAFNLMMLECAYIEVVREQDSSSVGPASLFVSHAWGSKLCDTVDCILQHLGALQGILRFISSPIMFSAFEADVCMFFYDLFLFDTHACTT